MLPRNLTGDSKLPQFHAQELSDGIPTVAGLAMLCSRFLAGMNQPQVESADDLPEPTKLARVILAAARDRGLVEIRGQSDSFDSTLRLIAVAVEISEDRRIVFRKKGDPAWTMGYLEAFRTLCRDGLVVHQFGREFVLSARGFEVARKLNPEDYRTELEAGIEEEI